MLKERRDVLYNGYVQTAARRHGVDVDHQTSSDSDHTETAASEQIQHFFRPKTYCSIVCIKNLLIGSGILG